MLFRHAELKALCRARGLYVSGIKADLASRLIVDGGLLTEHQAKQVRRVREEAASRGLAGLEVTLHDVINLQNASQWVDQHKMKCRRHGFEAY